MDPNNSASSIAPDNPLATTEAGPHDLVIVNKVDKSKIGPASRPKGVITYAPPRSLRARTSLPSVTSSSRASKNAGPPHDLDKIRAKLGPEGVLTRREEVIKEKEGQLRALVDGHDTAVREIFHLERYTSLLEGWDPTVSY
jgi:hypothetical protein